MVVSLWRHVLLLCIVLAAAVSKGYAEGDHFSCSDQTGNSVDISKGLIDHGFITLGHTNGCNNITIVDIPMNAWIGIFLAKYPAGGMHIQEQIVDDDELDKPVYSQYTTSENEEISIVLNEGTSNATVEFIVAAVIDVVDQSGRVWEDPAPQSGFVVSHQGFNGKETYSAKTDKTLTLNNLSSAVNITFRFAEVHWAWTGCWWRCYRACDDYISITGVRSDQLKLCGWDVSNDLYQTEYMTHKKEMNIGFFTRNPWYPFSSSESAGFLMSYNSWNQDQGCPPTISNSTRTELPGGLFNFTCDDGYETKNGISHQLINCSTDWDYTMCIPIRCEIPANWNQSHVNVTTDDLELMIGAVVHFSCNSSDFQLDPPESTNSTCLQNKTWSGTFPSCQELTTQHTTPSTVSSRMNTTPDNTNSKESVTSASAKPKLGTGAIVGVVIALLVVIAIVIILIVFGLRRRNNKSHGANEVPFISQGSSRDGVEQAADNHTYGMSDVGGPEVTSTPSNNDDANVYQLANELPSASNYENSESIVRGNQEADIEEDYTDILAEKKKPKFTQASGLIDNDLYGS